MGCSEREGEGKLHLCNARHLAVSVQQDQPMVHVVQIPSCSMSCKPAICICQMQTLTTDGLSWRTRLQHMGGQLARVQSYDMGNGFDPVSVILFIASKVTFS